MKQSLKRLPLAVAILSVLGAAHSAAAQDEPTVALETMNVTVDRQGAKSKTNVVTTATKNKRTETDLRGLLNEEPAINFGGGNGTSQWVTIRGMGQDQIDVKVDNAHTDTQFFHHQGRFMLDPALVKIVSVQKGAGSASAGIGATSGAIVAKTLDAKELLQNSTNENFGMKLNAGYHSNEGNNYGVSAFAKAGAFDVLLAGNWVNEKNYKGGDGYQDLYGGDVVKNAAIDQRGLLAKVGLDVNDDNRFVASYRQEYSEGVRALREEFDFSQDRLTASKTDALPNGATLAEATGQKNRKKEPTYYVKDANGNYIWNDANNAPRYRETKQETTMLEYTGKNLGFVDKVDANIYQIKGSRQEEALDRANNRTGIMNPATKTETTGANLNFDTWASKDSLLKYGVNYRHEEAIPATLANDAIYGQLQNQEKTDTGVYLESINYIGDFTVTGGLRYDHFKFDSMTGRSVSDGKLNPSLGIIYQATPALSFSANHNYATRSPRMYEAYLASGESRGARQVVSITEGTKAERAKNTEVGFNYNNGNFSADGSYFWQTVNNVIGYNPDTKVGDNEYRELANTGKIKNKGYEVGLGYRFDGALKGLSARISTAYQEPVVYGNITDANQNAVYQGRTWTGSLGYQLQNYPVEFGWRGRVVEDGEGYASRGSDGSVDAKNLQKRDGYDVHDFYVNWKPYNNDKMNVNFAINNAFDENYKPHSQRVGANPLVGVGRDFRVGVNFTY